MLPHVRLPRLFFIKRKGPMCVSVPSLSIYDKESAFPHTFF